MMTRQPNIGYQPTSSVSEAFPLADLRQKLGVRSMGLLL